MTRIISVVGSKTKRAGFSLDRAGREEELVVLFAGRGDDRIDLDLSAVHKAPSTRGRITVRGVLCDRASARVKGLIGVEKTARGAEDFLEIRTLLVGEGVKAEVFPYLEIENDDVRVSHAVPTGMVGQEQLFYLRSRGLSEKKATDLLVGGFLEELVADRPAKGLGSDLKEVRNYALG